MSVRSLIAMSGIFVMTCTALAADWPVKPVRVVVPVAVGSTTDIVPRLLLEHLAARLGQPMVVDNQVGAGGTIGSALVARAVPDGYTLLAHGSAHTIAPALYANLPFDPVRDFIPIVPFGISPSALVVASGGRFKTVGDLIAWGKSKPGSLTYTSVGVGSATHLGAERFLASAGIEALHVPMKGGGEAMLEVIAMRADFFFAPVGIAIPQIHAGKVVALVVNGSQRSPALPAVPTTKEAGLIDAEYAIWFGLFAPVKTPDVVIERLNREILKALATPELQERLAKLGVDPMPMQPAQFQAFVRDEVAINGALAKRMGLQPR